MDEKDKSVGIASFLGPGEQMSRLDWEGRQPASGLAARFAQALEAVGHARR